MTALEFVRHVLNNELNRGDKTNTNYLRMAYQILSDYQKEKEITDELELKLREIEEFIERVNREKEKKFLITGT